MAAGQVTAPSIIPLRVPVPGKPKTEIDTNTLVELKTDFPNVNIYYTVDGSKPDPFQQMGEKKTLLYKRPFRLPEGRTAVKAIAVTKDKVRESNIVNKTFIVEFVPGDSLYDSDEENLSHRSGRKSSSSLKSSTKATPALLKKVLDETQNEDAIRGSNYRNPTTGTRFLETRKGTKSASVSAGRKKGASYVNSPEPDEYLKKPPENLTQTNRKQRQTDFMKCVFCMADRPADPFARFCIACGSPVPALPNTRLPPPEPAQLGMCVSCNAMVPLNVDKCLVCETDIPPQLIPQASIKLKEKLVCRECGTGNPPNLEYCVTCEQRLVGGDKILKPTFSPDTAPPHPSKAGRLLCCNKCGRVNNSDARFCDWCGAKPAPTTSVLKCSRCMAANQAYSTFCHSCGVMIEPPMRQDIRNNGITVGGRATSQVVNKSGDSAWVPMSMPKPEPEKVTQSTQTVGLFYPSNKSLTKKEKEQEEQRMQVEAMSDRKPVLTAISPGKGYWRQQMDHICGHLKAHAQNNQDFRNMIGNPRMGKLISASVHEDGYELSLAVCFTLKGGKDSMTGKPLGVTQQASLSDLTEGRMTGYGGSSESIDSLGRGDKSTKKETKKKVKKKPVVNEKLSPAEKDLMREIGAKGEGDPEEIIRLLDEGASPNCENADGVPALTIAVINKHFECIVPLVEGGADINYKVGQKGNTALHEAVLLGYDGKQGAQELLNVGANPKLKNNRGETAFDLAAKGGHESIVATLASTTGQGLLTKMMKQNQTNTTKTEF